MDNIIDMQELRLEINEFLEIVKIFLYEETFKEAKESLEILCSTYLFPSNFNFDVINHLTNIKQVIQRLESIYELEMFIYSVYYNGEELVKFLNFIEEEMSN